MLPMFTFVVGAIIGVLATIYMGRVQNAKRRALIDADEETSLLSFAGFTKSKKKKNVGVSADAINQADSASGFPTGAAVDESVRLTPQESAVTIGESHAESVATATAVTAATTESLAGSPSQTLESHAESVATATTVTAATTESLAGSTSQTLDYVSALWDRIKHRYTDEVWIIPDFNNANVHQQGLFCSICKNAHRASHSKSAWIGLPCVNKDLAGAIRKHKAASTHVASIVYHECAEGTRKVVNGHTLIPDLVDTAPAKLRDQIVLRMKVLAWMTSELIPISKYKSLMELLIQIGAMSEMSQTE